MNQARPSPQTYPSTRSQTRERASRGVIASYIHELSERHNGGDSREHDQTWDLVEPSEGD